MTWDVPVKDDCPECGKTMFKRSGRGYRKPFCINEECPNFLPEDKRGYKRKTADAAAAETAGEEKTASREKKPLAKKPAAKKPAAKKTAAKKTAAAPGKTSRKKAAEEKE